MAYMNKMVVPDDFTLNADGLYEYSIPASTHGLGIQCYMDRALLRDENLNWENTITPYKIAENGDFTFYVEERGTYRVTLVKNE